MQTTLAYRKAARSYATGAQAFFAPGPQVEGERAVGGAVPVAELANRAEKLQLQSTQLASAASAQLIAAEPGLRLQASIGLLAKALTDLEVSRALVAAAAEGESEAKGEGLRGEAERGAAITRPEELDRTLQLLLGEEPKGLELAERGVDLPTSVEAARIQMAALAQSALLLIRDRTASTAWDALKGLAGLGAGQLAQAAGLVGMQVAEALGQAEKLTHLYELGRDFLGKALESIKTLLGPALAQTVGGEVVTWIKEHTTDLKFASLLEDLYQAEPTAQALAQLAQKSPAGLPQFITAIQGVDTLETAYGKQIELISKIVKAINFVALIPATALPSVKLVSAAAYILVGGYVVIAGGDYVDWQHLQCIDRVAGVRRIIETNLLQPSK